jgi:hypothetical protein
VNSCGHLGQDGIDHSVGDGINGFVACNNCCHVGQNDGRELVQHCLDGCIGSCSILLVVTVRKRKQSFKFVDTVGGVTAEILFGRDAEGESKTINVSGDVDGNQEGSSTG